MECWHFVARFSMKFRRFLLICLCFLVTFGLRGVPLRSVGDPWARGGVRGHIFHDFVMLLGGPLELILGPFSHFFLCFFRVAPGVAPGPTFDDFRLHFGLHFGTIFDAFWGPVDLGIFVTPPVRKLYFGGSKGSLFGTFFASFLGSVSGASF